MLPPDQAARDRARFELRRNVVVEAGAGTGKTTLLTDRILFTLLAGGPKGKGVDLTRLVALTFTEKAAGEVQLRLSGRLADVLAELEDALPSGSRRDEARRLLAEARGRFGLAPERVGAVAASALERMDRAMIGTIHHFASHVLRLHPLEAGVDPGFDVDTGPGLQELFESEWAAWLDAELGEAAPRRGLWLSLLPLVGLADLETLARSLCEEETCQAAPGATAAMRERLGRLAATLEGFGSKPRPGGASKILEGAAEAAARLKDLASACAGRGAWPERYEFRKVKAYTWPKAWEGDPDEAAYREATVLCAATSGDGERLVRRAVELVEGLSARVRERHRRRGLVSYFGLLRRARDLVRDHPAVREALKARWDALFIDEFQDTDPVQGELLLYLGERRGARASSWRELSLEAGKLFVVGDPKQSIYRFRGADMRAYHGFTELLLAQGAERCDLTTSFRGHDGVVDPVNAVHERLMTLEAGLQPGYLAIQPMRAALDGTAVELVVARLRDGERADDGRGREAEWIARWIAENAGPGRAYEFRHVAILLRTTTSLEVYLDALKRAGLPYAVEADRYFYGTQEALDLLNLLRVLDEPGDRVSMAGLLRSPLAGLDDRELLELREASGMDYRRDPPRALGAAARARLTTLYAALRGLRERAGREPLGDFVARVFRETFLLELASAAYYGDQTASNLLKFARLASRAAEERGATLKEFIGLVEREMKDFAREGESPLADEHLDAVRILSVHKSKGLEWPVVILPNLAAPPGGGDPPASRVDWTAGAVGLSLPKAKAADAAMGFLKLEEARRERYEGVRLLYVAMTRARDRLILAGSLSPGSEASFAGLLARAGAWPGDDAPEALTLGGRRVPIAYLDEEPAPSAPSRAAPATAIDLTGLGALWKARWASAAAAERPASTSATRLAALEDKPPARAGFERAEDAPAGASPRLVGVVCHRVLERWDFAVSSGATHQVRLREAVAREVARVEREGAADAAAIGDECRAILGDFIASKAARELARAVILGRELPFIYADGGQVVRGSIDLLYRAGGKLWIADYKTERVSDRELAALVKRHAVQAEVYREAVRRALGKPCGFKLVFLRTGQVIES
ncbi:MAG: UvrD-helicase domain-containing protein [Elusimicrobia bacterium]|nr:UvrD-helicase domain-containing protein [Elusimicrobiota bacterium]